MSLTWSVTLCLFPIPMSSYLCVNCYATLGRTHCTDTAVDKTHGTGTTVHKPARTDTTGEGRETFVLQPVSVFLHLN